MTTFIFTSKKAFAKKVGISERTLRGWLNGRYYLEMKILGYTKLQKKLSPQQIKFLSLKFAVVNEE